MKLIEARLRNFRRLEDVSIDFEELETFFVGPNNSGKSSATDIFRLFLKSGDFSIHDFSVSQIAQFDKYGRNEIDENELPSIELELWFSIDPDTEFGRVGILLPDTEQDYEHVGLRLRYTVSKAEELKENYLARYTPETGGPPKKTLSHFLSLDGTLKQYYAVKHYALEGSRASAVERLLPSEEGKRVVRSLVRVEFVDAQRKLDDHEQSGSTRLSSVFTGYYKRLLTERRAAETTHDLIDKHNEDLTKHYASEFDELLKVIQGLGVPSVNDRSLQLISSLVPESVLQSSTTLTYVDSLREHALPERYNGLGVKNLIYLAVQICDFHFSWMKTAQDRPLLLLLFIEEPECHLHAQAQQTFISNVHRIIKDISNDRGETKSLPQLVVTTHSSHILDTVDFAKVRYFRRCHCDGEDPASSTTLNASTVQNLQQLNPLAANAKLSDDEDEASSSSPTGASYAKETLDFFKKYMTLTHCDLFFADAAILVEGTVEKLLFPEMIRRVAPGLTQRYITVLEVGGAYSHRFAALLEFLSVPYLVITDIDAVNPQNRRSACRADLAGAVTSNASLKAFFNVKTIEGLVNLNESENRIEKRRCYVAYQRPSNVDGYTEKMHGRTFEETFAFENISLFRNKSLRLRKEWSAAQNLEAEYSEVYDAVNSSTFKKTDFALSVAASKEQWVPPKYISDGLKWLELELRVTLSNLQEGSGS